MGYWCGYLSGASCRLFAYGPVDAIAFQTPSSLASFKSRMVLPFWYRLTQVVLEKRPLNRCSGSSSMRATYVLWRLCMCSMSVCITLTVTLVRFVETAKMSSKLLKFLVKSLQEYSCSWELSESVELCRWTWLCHSLKLKGRSSLERPFYERLETGSDQFAVAANADGN